MLFRSTLIYPENPQASIYGGGNGAFAVINAFGKNGKPSDPFRIDVGLLRVNCVTYLQGIWLAGGYGQLGDAQGGASGTATSSSYDGGLNWTIVTLGDINGTASGFEIWTIIGGPIQDFKK